MLLSPLGLSALSLVLLLAGVLWLKLPIAVLLAGLGFGGIWLMNGFEAARAMISNEMWGSFSGYGMTVIPLFILMGQVCYYSGLNERLYKTLDTLVGHVPGGLAVATILACGGFSAICGSNTATAATMSGVALPEMRRYGYRDAFSAGTIAVGATLGVIIPPSVVLIVISIQTGLSVSKLFVASVLPGILLLLAFVGCAQAAVLRHPEWAPRHGKAPLAARLRALPGLGEVFILWGGVLGGMSTGLVTPTEAGGLGSLIALLMGALSRRLSLRGFAHAVSDTLRLTAMILLLVAGAMIYGKFLTATRLPFQLSEVIAGMHSPAMPVLLCMLLIYFIGGMVMDALALLLITVPVFFPLASGLGFDPVWFSIVITIVTTVGAVTPPVGVCSYVVSSMGQGIPLPDVFRGVMRYLPAYAAVIALLLAFPAAVFS
ncbi:MAG: TRAP transporter large permease [Mailhella sp.]|nr:TRAP transporter large permease [Mailhella sp.]